MQRHHADLRQACRCLDGAYDSVGYIVEFKVEEYAETETRELLERSRALGCE